MMSDKGKQKRSYLSWNNQMDAILIAVLYDQATQGNKGEGDWKPQAYQAVVDEMSKRLNMSVTTDHVRNRVKIWKKHYGVVTEIRTKTKFRWDKERKMVVVPIEDWAKWMEYVQKNPHCAPYSNKAINHWDDISLLVGPDRAIGDEGEHFEEGAAIMEEETGDGGSSSVDTSSNSRKKQKRDLLADAVTSFVESFGKYIDSKISTPTLNGKDVRDEVAKVEEIMSHQVLRAVKVFMKSPEDLQTLKDLAEEDKLDWVLLCLSEGI